MAIDGERDLFGHHPKSVLIKPTRWLGIFPAPLVILSEERTHSAAGYSVRVKFRIRLWHPINWWLFLRTMIRMWRDG